MLTETALPPNLVGEALRAFKITTDALDPFPEDALVLTDPQPGKSAPAGKLCVAVTLQGPRLGTMEEQGPDLVLVTLPDHEPLYGIEVGELLLVRHIRLASPTSAATLATAA